MGINREKLEEILVEVVNDRWAMRINPELIASQQAGKKYRQNAHPKLQKAYRFGWIECLKYLLKRYNEFSKGVEDEENKA